MAAPVALLCGCNLLALDDLNVDACEVPADCFVLAQAAFGGDVRDCFTCEGGACVPSDRRAEQRVAAQPPGPFPRALDPDDPDGLEIAFSGTTDKLIVVADRARDRDVEAWTFRSDDPQGLVDRGSVVYVGAAEAHIREHATVWLSPRALIGVSVDRLGCAKGRLRVGMADADEPFVLTDLIGTSAAFADQRVPGCPEAQGVRSPLVAVLRDEAGRVDALSAYLATSNERPRPRAEEPDREAPLLGLRWRGEGAVGQLALTQVGEAPVELARAVRAVAPVALALADPTPAFVIALATGDGLSLRVLPGFDDGLSVEAAETLPDPGVQAIALAEGPSLDGQQQFLVAWTSSDADVHRLRVAGYAWEPTRVRRLWGPLVAHMAETPISPPRVAYAPVGFATEPPRGGWSLAWAQAEGADRVVKALRLAVADHQPEAAITLAEASLPIAEADERSQFSYAYVSARGRETSSLARYVCE